MPGLEVTFLNLSTETAVSSKYSTTTPGFAPIDIFRIASFLADGRVAVMAPASLLVEDQFVKVYNILNRKSTHKALVLRAKGLVSSSGDSCNLLTAQTLFL